MLCLMRTTSVSCVSASVEATVLVVSFYDRKKNTPYMYKTRHNITMDGILSPAVDACPPALGRASRVEHLPKCPWVPL